MPALHDAIGDLGRAIRDARRAAGLNQADLAEQLEVSQGTVSRWESRRQLPEARLMGVLVERFGIEPALYFRAAAVDQGVDADTGW